MCPWPLAWRCMSWSAAVFQTAQTPTFCRKLANGRGNKHNTFLVSVAILTLSALGVSNQSSSEGQMSDRIKFRCDCGKKLNADAAAAGKRCKCTGCGQVVRIPVQPFGP